MKKLLSILTITTLTASVPAPLLANTVQTQTKRYVRTSISNNVYLPLKQSFNKEWIFDLMFHLDNLYVGTINGAFVLEHGKTQPTKIKDINVKVSSIMFDKNNSIYYFGTNNGNGIYKLPAGSDTPTKIDGITERIYTINFDSKDNLYYGTDSGAFVLKQAGVNVMK